MWERVRHSQDVYFTGNEKIGTTKKSDIQDRFNGPWDETSEIMEQVLVEGDI